MTQRNINLEQNDRKEGVKGIVQVFPNDSHDSVAEFSFLVELFL